MCEVMDRMEEDDLHSLGGSDMMQQAIWQQSEKQARVTMLRPAVVTNPGSSFLGQTMAH